MIEIGKKYGRLTCLKKDLTRDSRYYLFECECGNIKSIISYNVERGATKSCGCYQKEHPSHKTYGFSHTRLDNIYKTMIQRCYSKTSNRYHRYGGRGIKVCDEWLDDKLTFFDWALNNGYSDNLTIDRIDANGNYEPSNCRWATYTEQENNRSTNRIVTYCGSEYTLANLCRLKKAKYKRVYGRLKLGWTIERALED